jgi:integrase
MTVYDRWHKTRPKAGEEKCSCRPKRVPTKEHGCEGRWQVRYRDDSGAQRKKNFDKEPRAKSFDAEVKAALDRGVYVDPKAGQVTLEVYARDWRAAQTGDPVTLERIDSRLSNWVYGNKVGTYSMAALAQRPTPLRAWIKHMEERLAPGSIKVIVDTVSTIFNAALDDQIVSRNPFRLRSVQQVRPTDNDPKKVVPWTFPQVMAVGDEIGERLSALVYLGVGCAHRQGELFGIAVDDLDFNEGMVHVNRQVRLVNNTPVFALPKRGKTRSVPLPGPVGERVKAHIERFPPVAVTLPWRVPDGEPVTFKLLFTTVEGRVYGKNGFNWRWRSAIEGAGIVPATPRGEKRKPYPEHGCHVLRHSAASAWLVAGVDIVTVAAYLGHTDPGFTLRTYTHLMPSAADRARRAMEGFFQV